MYHRRPSQFAITQHNHPGILLQRVRVLLLVCLTIPRHSKALPYGHIRLRLRHQRIANILLTPARPALVVLLAERPNRHVTGASHELARRGRRLGSDSIDIQFQLLAVGFEGKIIDVVPEGILNFAADRGEPDDDVCGEYAPGDGDPAEVVPELEGEQHDVHPGDLGDGNGVSDRKWRGKNTIHASEGFVELDNTRN